MLEVREERDEKEGLGPERRRVSRVRRTWPSGEMEREEGGMLKVIRRFRIYPHKRQRQRIHCKKIAETCTHIPTTH